MKTKFRWMPCITICTMIVFGPTFAADEQVRVVPAKEFATWWQEDPAARNPPPAYFEKALRVAAEGCMAVAFLVHSNGSISNERVWLDTIPTFSWREDMEQSVLQAVRRWRFIPASKNKARTPVYSYTTFAFTLSDDSLRARNIRAKCRVPDFPQQVQAMINSAQTGKKP